jgi:hypothetical protein
VALEILVAPRDFKITQLQDEIQSLKDTLPSVKVVYRVEKPLVLDDSITEGKSKTTIEGHCTIRLNNISEGNISLSVTIDSNKPVDYENQQAGDRLVELCYGGV